MSSLSDFLRYGPDNMLKRERIPSETALPLEVQEMLDRVRAGINPFTGYPISAAERGWRLESILQESSETGK